MPKVSTRKRVLHDIDQEEENENEENQEENGQEL